MDQVSSSHSCFWISDPRAIQAVFDHRPQAAQKLLFTTRIEGPLGEWCHRMADNRKPYTKLAYRDFGRETGLPLRTPFALAVQPIHPASLKHAHLQTWHQEGKPVLFLDRIDEGALLGRIVRTASAFDIPSLVFSRQDVPLPIGAAAFDQARGAMETVKLYQAGALLPLLKPLKTQFLLTCLGGPGARKPDLEKPLLAPGRPLAVVLSTDPMGVDGRLAAACEHRIAIPMSEQGIPSLDASHNLAIVLHWIQNSSRRKKGRGFLERKKQAKGKAAT